MWGRQMGHTHGIACAVEIYLDGPEREEDLVVHEHSGNSDTHGAPGKQDVPPWLLEVDGDPASVGEDYPIPTYVH